MPVVAFSYMVLVLPFSGVGGSDTRLVNVTFWPVAAALTIGLLIINRASLDWRFLRSPPILALAAYLLFAAASISWALAPDYSATRYLGQLLIIICMLAPYMLPLPPQNTMWRLYLVCGASMVLTAYYIFTAPGSIIGHAGYFTHKQELGILCGVTLVLSAFGLALPGWRRLLAILILGLALWVVTQSQSKIATALLIPAFAISLVALVICRIVRTTPAVLLALFLLATYFVHDPLGRIAYRLYGDSTITGRVFIWEFINMWVSQRSWLGWGFHSYWGVPNSPHNYAWGFIKDMISTHSGYLDLKLDTGHVGYWLFMAFIFATLHVFDRARRVNFLQTWFLLSVCLYVMMLNLTETIWVQTTPVWLVFLAAVGEMLALARSAGATAPQPARRPWPVVRKFAVRKPPMAGAPRKPVT